MNNRKLPACARPEGGRGTGREAGSEGLERKYVAVSLAVILADQVSKYFVREKIFLGLLPIVENSALPFGLNLPGFLNLFLVAAVLLVFVVLYFLFLKGPNQELGFGLILGGAASNIFDRIGDGKATDFINLGISTLNLADLAIMIGIAALALNVKFKNQNVK